MADLAELYLVLKAKADPLIKSITDLKRELLKQMAEAGNTGGARSCLLNGRAAVS